MKWGLGCMALVCLLKHKHLHPMGIGHVLLVTIQWKLPTKQPRNVGSFVYRNWRDNKQQTLEFCHGNNNHFIVKLIYHISELWWKVIQKLIDRNISECYTSVVAQLWLHPHLLCHLWCSQDKGFELWLSVIP